MQKLLDTSSALYPTGLPTQRKIFHIPSGVYAGRAAALFQKSAGTIVLTFADPPFTTWPAAQNVVTDSADLPFSATMDKDGNIYLVYTQATTLALMMVKLSFANGVWTAGTVRQILTADSNYYPVIVKDRTDRLWAIWTRLAAADSKYYLQAKNSINDGATWGSGPTDVGTTLTLGTTTPVYGQVEIFADRIYAVYTDGGTKLADRYFPILGSVWAAEEVLATGTGFDSNFAIRASADGKLGVTYVSSTGLFYREFDGVAWSGALQIDTGGGAPLLVFLGGKPTVLYLKNFGTAQNQPVFSQKGETGFGATVPLFIAEAAFAKVFVYDASAAVKFQDKTAEASSAAAGDVLHSTSGAMLKDVGDALYLGAEEPFHFFRAIHSVAGVGGVVAYSYWNGSEWTAFTPDSGNYNFTDTGAGVYLWLDKSQIPSVWLKASISGALKYFLKIEVTTGFSTGPVGTQLSAILETIYPNIAG
ncbi:MAG: hypothetical protein L0196_07600 [candidate division Zixibacteria bacterium]|nr:hypothetical protein [candidate division Zixibacteria bacterium]